MYFSFWNIIKIIVRICFIFDKISYNSRRNNIGKLYNFSFHLCFQKRSNLILIILVSIYCSSVLRSSSEYALIIINKNSYNYRRNNIDKIYIYTFSFLFCFQKRSNLILIILFFSIIFIRLRWQKLLWLLWDQVNEFVK